MVRLFAALVLLGALSVEAQIQTQPTGLKKMDGSDSGGGGGSGTGWTYDAGEGAWIYTPASGNSDTRILSDGISLQDAAGVDIMAMDATLGATTYVAGRLAADAIEVRGSSSLAASGTITATNVTCSTGGGAVVGTLNATAGNVGRFVYVTRDGANTCTIGVASGQTLDGVTDGTTTVPSAGWKTFVQTTSTAWVTAGSYPVTGTLSGLTAPFLPVAASATTVANSDLSYYVGKWNSGDSANGRKLCFTDSTPLTTCLVSSSTVPGQGFVIQKSASEGAALGELIAGQVRTDNTTASASISTNRVGLYSTALPLIAALAFPNGEGIGWPVDVPDTQIKKDNDGEVGIYAAGSAYGQLNAGNVATSHYLGRGSTPTVGGSCGTSPTIAGKDAFIKVTTGSGSPTSCEVTFAVAYSTAPVCNVNASATTTALNVATTTTTVTVSAAALTAAEVLHISCGSF